MVHGSRSGGQAMLLYHDLNYAIGQHCTTSGNYFSMLTPAPVNSCILLTAIFMHTIRLFTFMETLDVNVNIFFWMNIHEVHVTSPF